jgi:hypothetical protein
MALKGKHFAVALVTIGLVLGGLVVANPLRRSEAGVSSWLAKRTPLGSSEEQVRAVAHQHGWYNPNLQGSDGLTSGPYIRGELGRYWSVPFYTYVTVFWEFDSSNHLANIRIWKTTDGI